MRHQDGFFAFGLELPLAAGTHGCWSKQWPSSHFSLESFHSIFGVYLQTLEKNSDIRRPDTVITSVMPLNIKVEPLVAGGTDPKTVDPVGTVVLRTDELVLTQVPLMIAVGEKKNMRRLGRGGWELGRRTQEEVVETSRKGKVAIRADKPVRVQSTRAVLASLRSHPHSPAMRPDQASPRRHFFPPSKLRKLLLPVLLPISSSHPAAEALLLHSYVDLRIPHPSTPGCVQFLFPPRLRQPPGAGLDPAGAGHGVRNQFWARDPGVRFQCNDPYVSDLWLSWWSHRGGVGLADPAKQEATTKRTRRSAIMAITDQTTTRHEDPKASFPTCSPHGARCKRGL
ncbi:hypothetical protein GW17_00027352 [Ensete ventricosum]|nr:hypothetical protein GW17_00027352 [Ensete ventricosum]